jgi:hypothetical protein
MTANGNCVPVRWKEDFLPKLVLQKERPKTSKKIGSAVLNGLVETTFSIANEYVRENRDLISYDVNGGGPRILQFDKLTGDYTKIDVYFDADEAWNIRMNMDRGTFTRYGNRSIDEYDLSHSRLIYYSRGYETDLIEKDYSTEELSFCRGIGPKRQARAIGVIALMQNRLRNLLDGDPRY